MFFVVLQKLKYTQMKYIVDFFTKHVEPKSGLNYAKARAFAFMLSVISFLVVVLISYILAQGTLERAYNAIIELMAIIGTLFLIRSGRYKLAADILSYVLVSVMILSMSNITKYPGPFYFFIQFYMFLAFIIFSALFARLHAFFSVIILVLISSFVIHRLRLPYVSEDIKTTVEYGFVIYLVVVLIISILSYIFSKFVSNAIKDLDVELQKGQVKNIDNERLIHQMTESSQSMHSIGSELKKTSQVIAKHAETQASQVEEISSEMEEMTGIVLDNAENAEKTYQFFKATSEHLKQSSQTILQAIELINSISDRTQQISEIAFQTNILSLNAAIESAKAKRYGLGFAVVADEVRKLAAKSNAISTEITQLSRQSSVITDILKRDTELNLAKSSDSLSLVESINQSSIEQATAIRSVNSSIQKLSEISTHNAQSASLMQQFAAELAGIAEKSKKH